jgi:hypothetical protein
MQNLAACQKGKLRFLPAKWEFNFKADRLLEALRRLNKANTEGSLLRCLGRFRVKLERKSHSCTKVGNIAEILVAVKVASVDKGTNVIGEAVL